MKILLITDLNIDDNLSKYLDDVRILRSNSDNIFEDWMIVLDKYSTLIEQLFYWNGIFINTIFSFLQKLKSQGESLYFRKLHTKLLERFRELLKHNPDIRIMTYRANCSLIEYLDVECFDYISFNDEESLIGVIKKFNK